jgi:hypothetical protein
VWAVGRDRGELGRKFDFGLCDVRYDHDHDHDHDHDYDYDYDYVHDGGGHSGA